MYGGRLLLQPPQPMSHSYSRSSRVALVTLVVLLALGGIAPRVLSVPADSPSLVPFVGVAEIGCTRGSGGPICAGHHSYDAIDFLMPTGTPLVAPVAGVVSASNGTCPNHPGACGNGYGNWVQISAADGSRNYLLAHLSEVVVVAGWVEAGDVVGYSGNSGSSSTPHLHYEERTHDLDERGGEQLPPGDMTGCFSGDIGLDYPTFAGEETWYDLASHAGIEVISNTDLCFIDPGWAGLIERRGLELAAGSVTDGPGAVAASASDWLADRSVYLAGDRLDPELRRLASTLDQDAMDFSTVWRIPPLR